MNQVLKKNQISKMRHGVDIYYFIIIIIINGLSLYYYYYYFAFDIGSIPAFIGWNKLDAEWKDYN